MTSTQPRPIAYEPPAAKTGTDIDYDQVVEDLSAASVHRNFDPYIHIAWDAPEMAIVPNDPRWILDPEVDPVGKHPWYKALPEEKQIQIGMWRQANVAKVGLQFESILIRGLLQYASKLKNGDKRFRYVTHESKEECQHTLMFQEMVNRVGMDVPGMPRGMRLADPIIPLFSTFWPTVFFFGVLAGEEPIDHLQKDFLRAGANVHPVMAAVMELHVAEEARHISFAHHHLRTTIPSRSAPTRFVLSMAMPVVMRVLCGAIARPPVQFRREFDVPDQVFKEMFWKSEDSRNFLSDVFGDVRMLAEQCGLMNPVSRRIWKALGIDGRSSRYRSEPSYNAR
ncbi:diiron oxygenase [Gordonia alkaliphila]|uniref:Diiron oxygenase n=1 Tax=Gordonia alkaliphila TaxID=1053547 RepID=A0ABP8YXM3_9ACTN|nr:diiron oxygenase [Gordonia alkaliphila]MCK0439733.1 diiron oxygenase [Gordonia alkaliphila]